jgi:hypothetical protein
MFDALSRRLARLRRRAVEAERREIREFGRWLENTRNLIHLSLLLVVPLVIGLVTWLSNEFAELSFLLFPPLASGAYTLFADPEGRYASPWRFVAGLTVGAVCGWFALELTVTVLGHVPADGVSAVGAAVGIFLAGVATWAFDVEEPAAASTALLVLVTGTSEFAYVVSVAVSSAIVAGAFVVWRSHFYERRARYLYRSTEGDDHVLVPVRGDRAERAVAFGAGLAAAHEAGKVVLLSLVDESDLDAAAEGDDAVAEFARSAREEFATDGGMGTQRPDAPDADAAESARGQNRVVRTTAPRLERLAEEIRAGFDVPCEVIVAASGTDPGRSIPQVAHEANCDLVVAPSTPDDDRPLPESTPSGVDLVSFHPRDSGDAGDADDAGPSQVLVPVSDHGAVAHQLIDFARRTVDDGTIGVCAFAGDDADLRRTERMLADLIEPFDARFDVRITRSSVCPFLADAGTHYDLVITDAATVADSGGDADEWGRAADADVAVVRD